MERNDIDINDRRELIPPSCFHKKAGGMNSINNLCSSTRKGGL